MFKQFWGKNVQINQYKLTIVSSKQSGREKIQHFQTHKIGQKYLLQPKYFYVSDLDKIHMVGRGLLQKHFSKVFVKISAVTQK